METMRCFIAVEMPHAAKEILSDIQKSLKSWPAKVKWVEKQNFHLTLKFLGDVPHESIGQIEDVLSGVSSLHKEWQITLEGIGTFPDILNPRVIWAGIRDNGRGLTKIHNDLEKELEKLGFTKEKRRFSPHLTLGRVKVAAGGFAEIIKQIKPLDHCVSIKELKLMKSRLTPYGPEYSCINSFYLQEH